MQAADGKPAYNAKRRIQLLAAFCVFLIIAATGGWYFVAGKIREGVDQAFMEQAQLGTDITCENHDVRGYPFRFGLFCDRVEIQSSSASFAFSANALRSAAQFYEPSRLVVELDGPAEIKAPSGQVIRIDWEALRSTGVVAQPLPERLSIVGRKVRIDQGAAFPTVMADQLEAHMRTVDADLDLAGRTASLSFENGPDELTALPPLGADFDLRIDDGAALAATGQLQARNSKGELKRFAILLSPDRGILVSGPFTVDAAGLVYSQLEVRIIDVDAVMNVLGKALPDAAPMLTAFANGQQRSGEKNDEVTLTLTISKSNVRLGLIPIATLKPL